MAARDVLVEHVVPDVDQPGAARRRRARLIHIGHDVPHAEIARRYGPAVLPTFDGEAFEL